MKKFIILILIVALGYFIFTRDKAVELGPENVPEQNENFRPSPTNATFLFDDEPITLSSGKNVTSAGEETSILEYEAYGDLNGDGKQDSIVLIGRSGGGSGVFIYAAAYVSGPVNYKGSNAVFLGDRIAPQNISIKSGVATVTFLDRRADEPFAAEPTVNTTIELVYKGGELVER